MLSLANQVGKALVGRHDWQRLQVEQTFTATATETQSGVIASDFERIVPGSFFNRTQGRRVVGPLSVQRWQHLKTSLVFNPWDSFRIRGNALLMSPTPTAGDSMAFEYITSNWCMGEGETTPDQSVWTSDTDTSIWPDELHTLGIHWRYLSSRGLDYAEPFNAFERELARLIANDGGIADLSMVSSSVDEVSEPYVSEGSWNLT